MLRAKVLPEVLGQAVTHGVHSVMLLTPDGALLGCTASDAHSFNADRVVGAIVANVHGEYKRVGSHAYPFEGAALTFLVMDCEEGKVGVLDVCAAQYLLCAYAATDVDVGLLKRKLEALRDHLEGPGGLKYVGDMAGAATASARARAEGAGASSGSASAGTLSTGAGAGSSAGSGSGAGPGSGSGAGAAGTPTA